MSGIVNKVKDALHSDKSSTTHSSGTTHGHTTAHTGTTGTTGTSGLHESSNITRGTHEGAYSGVDSNRNNLQKTDGPHNSNLLNKADPRVDSDRDYSRNLGANPDRSADTSRHGHNTLGSSTHTTGTTTTGTTGLHESSGLNRGTHEAGYTAGGLDSNRDNFQRTDGPHNSNLANKVDPRVDSDRDYSRNLGANPDRSADTSRHGHNTLGSTGTTGTSAIGSTGRTGNTYEGSNTLGSTTGRTGGAYEGSSTLGSTGHSTGTHHTTGTHTTGTHTTGNTLGGRTAGGLESSHLSGPAPNTQGPHKSDLLNKADPRVDSDADGSKTYGGNKTYAQ